MITTQSLHDNDYWNLPSPDFRTVCSEMLKADVHLQRLSRHEIACLRRR